MSLKGNPRRKKVRQTRLGMTGLWKDSIHKSRCHAQSRAKWKKTGKRPPWRKKTLKEEEAIKIELDAE